MRIAGSEQRIVSSERLGVKAQKVKLKANFIMPEKEMHNSYKITKPEARKILLHVCCSVCAASVVERLREEGWEVTCFFYNPNIHPRQEYKKRLESFLEVTRRMKLEYIGGDYEAEKWQKRVKGWEKEKEGGKRCEICFRMRLEKTREIFQKGRFAYFTSTLTVSPHKNAELINRIGENLSPLYFLSRDFKKQEGFKRSITMAKEWGLYRQRYCGCVFSCREKLQPDKQAGGGWKHR